MTERVPNQKDILRHKPEWEKWRAAMAKRIGEERAELSERAWAAGLFDGEGHARSRGLDDILAASPKMDLSIDQKYGELGRANLDRFHCAVGNAGNIVNLKRGGARWLASSEEDVSKVWAAIGPFLGLAKFIQFAPVRSIAGIRHLRTEALGKISRKKRPHIHSVTILPRKPK